MAKEAIISLDLKVCSIESAQKAAYRSINHFTINIQTSDTHLNCKLISNTGVSDEAFDYAVQEFRKNILDEELRLKLKKETEPVRNLILGIAFSKTGLQKDE
jgi:His-Xaa-Ser system protein HxsD